MIGLFFTVVSQTPVFSGTILDLPPFFRHLNKEPKSVVDLIAAHHRQSSPADKDLKFWATGRTSNKVLGQGKSQVFYDYDLWTFNVVAMTSSAELGRSVGFRKRKIVKFRLDSTENSPMEMHSSCWAVLLLIYDACAALSAIYSCPYLINLSLAVKEKGRKLGTWKVFFVNF